MAKLMCMNEVGVKKEKQVVNGIISTLKESLNDLLDHFDREKLLDIIHHCFKCKGILFFTGVGKSGIIAKKIVMTLNSLGTKAIYLSAQDALHGDIGVVGEGDSVFLLSKSGESEEIIRLCPALRNKGAFLVAVTSQTSSRLEKASDMTFVLPRLKELCPFDLIPTTSTLSQLIFGDILAMSLLHLKEVSLDQFIQNHPGGRIGRRELLKVQDLMLKDAKIPKASPHACVVDILHELSSKQCGCIFLVDEEGQLLGIFTDGDLRRAIQKHNQDVFSKTVGELMTKSPRITYPHIKAKEALEQMEADQAHPITVLGVVDESRTLVGVLKLHDVLQTGI